MSASTVGVRLAEASARVGAACEALGHGQAVDLDGLGDMVEQACRDLAALGGADAKTLEGRLMALYDELNSLAEMLAREQGVLKRALNDLGAHERAQSAYAKAARDKH